MKKSRAALGSLTEPSSVNQPKSRPSLLSAAGAIGLGGSLAALAARRKQSTDGPHSPTVYSSPPGSTSSSAAPSTSSAPGSTGATASTVVEDEADKDKTAAELAIADSEVGDAELSAPEEPPAPNDDRKPDSPTELTKRSWVYVLKRTVREFGEDECTDLAAGLTYYAVLSIFPAAIALLSVLGVVGRGDQAIDTMLDVLKPLLTPEMLDQISELLTNLSSVDGAGVFLVIGILGALFTASGYVGAFGRAMNRIYEVDEGRPIWVLRPLHILITVIALVTLVVALVIVVVSGPLAESIGSQIGLGDTALLAWSIAKWPVLGLLAVMVLALLYYATPNVKQPKFRWISLGAVVALVILVLASAGFAFYVLNFGSYNATYGAAAGGVVLLLLIWIINVALLFGAELDSELERGRQLQSGLPAETELQLPVRSSRNIDKARAKEVADIKLARQIRADSGVDWSEPESDSKTDSTAASHK